MKHLNITAYHSNGDEVSLQIPCDMVDPVIINAIKQWLDWGYSFKAGYDAKVGA